MDKETPANASLSNWSFKKLEIITALTTVKLKNKEVINRPKPMLIQSSYVEKILYIRS